MALELKKPSELPAAVTVSGTASILVDNGVAVEKATPKQIVDAGRPIASEAQAITGTNNTASMTPLTTKQAMDYLGVGVIAKAQAWAESPTAPGAPGTKSAKTWAEYAETAAGMSRAYAVVNQVLNKHTLDVWRLKSVARQNVHFFAGPMVSITSTAGYEHILQLFTEGPAHGRLNLGDATKRDVGRTIKVARSYDAGATFAGFEPLPGQVSSDGLGIGYSWHGVQMVKTGTGRIIILALARNELDEVKNFYWVSDSDGAGWTGPTEIPSASIGGKAYFPHSAMTVPTSDGGNDTLNATFFCYGGNEFRTLYTNDNGVTWGYGASVAAGKSLGEPWVFRAAAGKYVCICRDETAADAPGWAFTTDTPLAASWGAGRDSGLTLGRNPPFAHVTADGFVDMYSRSIPTSSSVGGNRIAWVRENALDVYNNGGVFSNDFGDAGPLEGHLTGYWFGVNHMGRDIFTCTLERNPWNTSRPAECAAVYFTPDKPVSLTLGAVRDMTLTNNLLDNASFHYTPFGNSFSAMASGPIAGRWAWDGSGGKADIALEPLPYDLQRNSTLGVTNGLKIQSVTRGTYSAINQTFTGVEWLRRFSNRRLNFSGKMFGSAPSLRFVITVFFGTGGSTTFIESSLMTQTPSGGLHQLNGSIAAPDLAGKTITNDCFVRISVDGPQDTLDWDAWFFDFELTMGDWPRPTLPINPRDELEYLEGFTEILRFDADSEVAALTKSNSSSFTFRGSFFYKPKFLMPSAPVVITGSAASLRLKPPLLSDITPLSVAFDNQDRRGCRVSVNLADVLSPISARLTSASDFFVRVSCEA